MVTSKAAGRPWDQWGRKTSAAPGMGLLDEEKGQQTEQL